MKFLRDNAHYLLLIFVGVIFFIRCYEHVPSGDELLYEWVWEADDDIHMAADGHRFEHRVTTISDAVQSQVMHYKYANGRSIIHAIEQLFTDHEFIFSFVNTLVFVLFVALIIKKTTGSYRGNYVSWILVLIFLLYLFPFQGSLWTSVNFGLNYLWPATMAMGMILYWDKVAAGQLAGVRMLPMILLSLVFGWTHEGYVVGVAGGMFIYYCVHFSRYRGAALAITIPVWVTAVIMVFAPGNMIRFFGEDGGSSIFIKLANGFDNMMHLVVWNTLLTGCIILWFTRYRRDLIQYLKINSRLLYIMMVAICFSLIANTAPYSHNFIELLSLLLIIGFINYKGWVEVKWAKYAAVALTVPFVIFQIVLAKDTITIYRFQKDLVKQYMQETDGLLLYDEPDINPMSYRLIRHWDSAFYTDVYRLVYGKGKKRFLILTPADYQAISKPESFFVEKNKMSGNAPVYEADGGMWMWIDPAQHKTDNKYIAKLYPVDFWHDAPLLLRIKFAMSPGAYPTSEELKVDTLHTRYGESYRIAIPLVRRIASIDLNQ